MYQNHFSFDQMPFTLSSGPEMLLALPGFQSAWNVLEYDRVRGEGVAVVTGDPGCGKSLLIRTFAQHADEHLVLGVIHNPELLEENLWFGLAEAFQMDGADMPRKSLTSDLQHALRQHVTEGRQVMLIIDEAQYLSNGVLERLRLFMNGDYQSERIMQLVLVGQNELKPLLFRPENKQLRQRVLFTCHLGPLSFEGTRDYIDHRLEAAGARDEVFSPSAVELVFRASSGIPRLINVICDMALLYGYAEHARRIDVDVMKEVVADRNLFDGRTALIGLGHGAGQLQPVVSGSSRHVMQSDDRDIARQLFNLPSGNRESR